MLFASKIIQDKPLQVSNEEGKMNLIITNISLDPQSNSALLYLCLSQSKEEQILIVSLKKQGLETYQSNIELSIEKPIKFMAKGGTVHVLGIYQLISTSITNSDKSNNHTSLQKSNLASINQQNSKKTQSIRTLKKARKQNAKPQQKYSKKWSTLMQSMDKQLQLNDDDDDDDESYSQQGDQSSSSDSELEEEKQECKQKQKPNKKQSLKKKKQNKKAANWAELLTKKDDDQDNQDDEDDDYSEQSQQESSQSPQNQQQLQLQNTDKQTTKNEKDIQKVVKKINDKTNKVPHRKNPQPKEEKIKVNESNNESDSFQYKVPSDLPDFVTKNDAAIIL